MAQAFYRRGFRRGALVFLHWFLSQHLFLGMRRNFAHRAFRCAATRGVRLRIRARHLFSCLTSVPWIADSTLRARRALSRRRMGRLAADWLGLVRSERRCSLGWSTGFRGEVSRSLASARHSFGFRFEVFRAYLPEISFPWNLLGYPASANIALAAAHDDYRNLRSLLSRRCVQRASCLDRRRYEVFAKAAARDSCSVQQRWYSW